MSIGNDNTSFNLMDRQWLQVIMKQDGAVLELSIKETLRRAKDIECLTGDNTIQQFALVRLLEAIVYGSFGNDFNEDAWWGLYERGPEDEDVWHRIEQYCDAYHDRFDLFDAKQPFYQVAGLHTAKHEVSGLERIILDVPAGDRLFTIRGGESLQTMSAAEAARWLVTVQAFDPSGIKSGAVGDPRVKGGKGYPIGVAWSGHLGGYICEGNDLWTTLMLNYVSRHAISAGHMDVDWTTDTPIWERPPLTQCAQNGYDQPAESTGVPRYFHGPATLYTWQSRRILLSHDGETVNGVLICNGDRLKPQNAENYEPMTSWRRSDAQEKKLKIPVVYMPRKHDPSRALWRNLPTITVADAYDVASVPERLRPLTFNWLQQLQLGTSLDMPIRIHAYGVEYGNQEAVIDTIVDDKLDLNLSVLTSKNPQVGDAIAKAVNIVDAGIRELAGFAGNLAKAAGRPEETPRAHAHELAYSQFDYAFRQWIATVTEETIDEDIARWKKTAKSLLYRLCDDLSQQASPQAIVGREISSRNPKTGETTSRHYDAAVAQIWFRAKINTIIPEEGE